MKLAYFDCFNGAAGDMILAALIDAGANAGELRQALRTLPVDGYTLAIEKTTKQGFAATRVDITLDSAQSQPHRHLSHIRKIIDGSGLTETVKRRATVVFERLARAEAEVHGTTVERVHFHEVGAVDAILDIVGVCWAVDRLQIGRVVCSPIPVGSGTVTCSHGVMPVPAPATTSLLKGVPIAETAETGELTTPTGAALLTEFASSFGPMPAMRIAAIGIGAGHRDGKTRPNVFRVIVGDGEESTDTDRIAILEANIDDATPEIVGFAIERLLKAGALDAYCVPIHMKKSRPAMLLTVLSEVDSVTALEAIIFQETTTFGVRRHDAMRSKLARRIDPVETRYGAIGVKVGTLGGRVVTVSAEYDDCRAAAQTHNVALRIVMAEACDQWQRSHP